MKTPVKSKSKISMSKRKTATHMSIENSPMKPKQFVDAK